MNFVTASVTALNNGANVKARVTVGSVDLVEGTRLATGALKTRTDNSLTAVKTDSNLCDLVIFRSLILVGFIRHFVICTNVDT
jgi:hypothetical protein